MDLDIWEDSCAFAKAIYMVCDDWKDFGLKSQITRSAVSIASNIAEGSDRDGNREFIRFLRIAKASCAECRTQLRIANMIGTLPKQHFQELDSLAESISKRIASLAKYLTNHKPQTTNHKPQTTNH